MGGGGLNGSSSHFSYYGIKLRCQGERARSMLRATFRAFLFCPHADEPSLGTGACFFLHAEKTSSGQTHSTRLCCGDEALAFFSARDQLDKPDLFVLCLLKERNQNVGTGVERAFGNVTVGPPLLSEQESHS